MNQTPKPFIPTEYDYKTALEVTEFLKDKYVYDLKHGRLNDHQRREAIEMGDILTKAESILTDWPLSITRSFPDPSEVQNSIDRRRKVLNFLAERDGN